MADWATVSSLATAGGTLVLALATFASVRSANRAARTAERALQVGMRPLLVPSRLQDPAAKVMWGDEHWASVGGGRASIEVVDGSIYLAMSLRNVATGIAVLQGWHPEPAWRGGSWPHVAPEGFRPQLRDLYVPAGDVGYWQAAIRDRNDDAHASLLKVVQERQRFTIDLLYSDHEGGQRAIGRFTVAPAAGSSWLCGIVRHWNLDRPDPR
jgi:hypothetical protein